MIELSDYPEPIIDHRATYRAARDRLWAMRECPKVSAEAERILSRHVDRKRKAS